MYCIYCGKELHGNFCGFCGHKAPTAQAPVKKESDEIFNDVLGNLKDVKNSKGQNILQLRFLLSDVFKKHTREESETIFIAGTTATTPDEMKISSTMQNPWLYSRILLLLGATFLFLYFCTTSFHSANTIPGLIFMGSIAVPFSLLIFFLEANTPRNISVFVVVKMFFLGGVGSLVVTLFLYEVIQPGNDLNYLNAILVGVVEEIGKLVIVAFFIKTLNPKYVLNGLLIGAAIGAGFATFESAGYAFRIALSSDSLDMMMQVIILRGVLSGGGHIVWAAISGAAICLLKKDRPFSMQMLFHVDFLKMFAVSVVLHAIWDMPIEFLNDIFFIQIMLTLIAWVFIIAFIKSGYKQIIQIQNGAVRI